MYDFSPLFPREPVGGAAALRLYSHFASSIFNSQFSIFNFNCITPLQSFSLSLFIGIHLMLGAFANSTILLTLAKWWVILILQTASAPMN